MSKSAERHTGFVNDHEMNDWLVRNNYKQTEQNRRTLRNLSDRLRAEHPHVYYQHLSLKDLDQHHAEHGIPDLDKAM